ncbi:MAG: hypothetical protein EON54_23845 [Alcaligenaceae bacterium]|nr:MAG: hypothetical protein EON54_23845 [Alcaligenaceae bacterium]
MDSHAPVIWADLVRLKKAAKAAKASLPNLSHAQRLDALAQQEFGARHYHELLQRYEKHAASHVYLDGAHYCRYCNIGMFSDFDPDDRKAHQERHRRFEEAERSLTFLPLAFKSREDMKLRFGYEQFYQGSSAADRRVGALAIILSHYDRSLERAIESNRWHKHPCLVEFLPCAIANSTFLAGDVLDQLASEFGEQPGVIVEGDTDWPAGVERQANGSSPEAVESKRLREEILTAYRGGKAKGMADTATATPTV